MTVIEQESDSEDLIELPEDIAVESVGVVSAARSMEIEQRRIRSNGSMESTHLVLP